MQQEVQVGTQETRSLYRLALNRVKGCFLCLFGCIKAAESGPLEGLSACDLIKYLCLLSFPKVSKWLDFIKST